MLDTVNKQDDGLLGNIGNLLGGDPSSALTNQGNSMLCSQLGSGALGQIEKVIAIPGVGALIQPVIGPVLETLQGVAS